MEEKVVGYVRVSTEGQVRDGYSWVYQVEEIQRYCNENELQLLHIYEDKGISGALIITTIFCPLLGIAASVVYGGLQVKSAIEGEDWGTHRKLSKEEQVEDGFFGALDLIPGLGSLAKAFKEALDVGSLVKLTKLKEGIGGCGTTAKG
ncbi:recombinase family protein [Bacillus cytotoxicus]|uniref:recombinase family protein n=1 Tax=Bacillus cytotoxicus TaxID=580165 RepID=UPI001EF6FE9C|nr:recombinase family protein [Bacillus cytotoxicus]MDH2862537.1 recombinase family protein [Bacillus cytotoxicus]MDH2870514.1 recombinase family protein [Bacillus cytotoxicus]MDH2874484.1 recombinase family protein [Bacillus cytotoxicus]MDH2878627.1 recombinase family protein [Bacillus cytotoxicus]MDH2894472.1 recombinase family protein [Bacillus cytotoxicus]